MDEIKDINVKARLVCVKNIKGERTLGGINYQGDDIINAGTYLSSISHELQLTFLPNEIELNKAIGIGLHFIDLLKICSPSEAFAFLCVDRSWVELCENRELRGNSLGALCKPSFQTINFKKHSEITQDHLSWALSNWPSYIFLTRDHDAFSFSCSIYTRYHFSDDLRSTVVNLWSAIESLFNIDRELRNGLALHTSCFLFERGIERKNLYSRIKKMYDVRSSIVHGRRSDFEKIAIHLIETRDLLGKILKRTIELGHMPTTESIFLEEISQNTDKEAIHT